jgi:hypothetical protein
VHHWTTQVTVISLRIEYDKSVSIWSFYTKTGRVFAEFSVYTALDFIISDVCNSPSAVEVNPELTVSSDVCN